MSGGDFWDFLGPENGQHNIHYDEFPQSGTPSEPAAPRPESGRAPVESAPAAASSSDGARGAPPSRAKRALSAPKALRTSVSSSGADETLKILEDPPPPPKNFEVHEENIDRKVARGKNRFDPSKKLRGKKITPKLVAPPPESITEQSTIRIHEGEEKGKPLSEWASRPEWNARKQSPYLKGADANRKAIETINAQVQSPKPKVTTVVPCGVGGRYDWEVIEAEALDHIAAGGNLASYCRFVGLKYITMTQHQLRHPEFQAKVVEARRQGADALAEEALKIASTPMITEETIEVYNKDEELVNKSVKRADNVYARKLAFQARMQLIEKWAPDKYGPNAKGEASGGMAEKLRSARMRILSANRERQAERRKDVAELTTP